MAFALFGFQWMMARVVVDLLACWQGHFGRHWNGVI